MRILIAEDEKNVAYTLQAILESEGWQVDSTPDGRAAFEAFTGGIYDLVITDLTMPRMDGMALLHAVRAASPQTPVVLVTAQGNERVAVEAIRAGAWDYFRKPFVNAEVIASVRRALEVARLRRDNAALRSHGAPALLYDPQHSPSMAALDSQIARVAAKDVTVLVTGETGTGKEVIARLLHARSLRADKPFVAINCGALNESLIEAELFGWEKGAFTGAAAARAGYFEQADGGTLLLDEIGDMPLALQAKLLRVLQEGEVQRLGSTKARKVDVRIVAATHQNLHESIQRKTFREDLFFRLNVIHLHIPPLRERRADIPLLAKHFAALCAERFETGTLVFDEGALEALAAAEWRGNVRELAHAIEKAAALSADGMLRIQDLESTTTREAPGGGSLTEQVDAFESRLIAEALASTQGNQSAAARRLGIARATLLDKMKKHNIRL